MTNQLLTLKIMRRLFGFLLLFSAAFCFAQGTGGIKNIPIVTTVSNLTYWAKFGNGTVIIVKDGSSTTDCATGGGSTAVICIYNGSSWVATGGSGGAGVSLTCGAGLTCSPSTITGTGSLTPALQTGINQPSNPSPAFFASAYGVTANTKIISDATFSTSNATIDCSFSNDCNFVSGDVGKICFGSTPVGSPTTIILPQGTISSVTDSQHAVCSGGNATANATHNAYAVWGTDDSTTLAAAYTAANAGPNCGVLELPVGYILVQQAEFISGTCPLTHVDIFAPLTVGTGIIPTPNFNFTTCTGGAGGSDCFGGVAGEQFFNIQINGLGSGTGTHNNVLVESKLNYAVNSNFQYWCGTCTGSIGFQMGGVQSGMYGGGVTKSGATACQATGANDFINGAVCTGGTTGLNVTAANFQSNDSFYTGGTNSIVIGSGGSITSTNDTEGGGTGGASISGGGTASFYNFNEITSMTVAALGTASFYNSVLQPVTNNGTVYFKNTYVPATSGGVAVGGSGTTWDQGGNNFVGQVTSQFLPFPGYIAPAGSTQIANDSGNHANGALASTWTNQSGTACTYKNLQIAEATASVACVETWTGSTFASNQYSQVEDSSPSNTSGNFVYATIRGQSGAQSNYAGGCNSTQCFLYHCSAGTCTQFGGSPSSNVGGKGHVYRLEGRGTTITLYLDGLSVLSGTDSTWSSGSPGVELVAGSSTTNGAINFYAGNLQGSTGHQLNALWTGDSIATSYETNPQCFAVGTSASPSVVSCGSAAAGLFSCATNASTATCTVNTTAVDANSSILVLSRGDTSTGTKLGVTCNTTAETSLTANRINAISAGTSFTINLGTFSTNPECFSYLIIN